MSGRRWKIPAFSSQSGGLLLGPLRGRRGPPREKLDAEVCGAEPFGRGMRPKNRRDARRVLPLARLPPLGSGGGGDLVPLCGLLRRSVQGVSVAKWKTGCLGATRRRR